MKHTLILLLLSLPLYLFAQDSAKVEVSNVVIKAKDINFFYLYLEKNNKNEPIDSIVKLNYRPTAPNDNTDVTFNAIERRVWRDILTTLSNNSIAIHPANDIYKRVRNAVQLINDTWLNDKIIKLEANVISQATAIQDAGKKAARRIED